MLFAAGGFVFVSWGVKIQNAPVDELRCLKHCLTVTAFSSFFVFWLFLVRWGKGGSAVGKVRELWPC